MRKLGYWSVSVASKNYLDTQQHTSQVGWGGFASGCGSVGQLWRLCYRLQVCGLANLGWLGSSLWFQFCLFHVSLILLRLAGHPEETLLKAISEAQEDKPNHASTYQTPTCIMSLTKAITQASPTSKGQGKNSPPMEVKGERVSIC